jgi:CRP/FNR family nitrogen fixation transcriptional regulator
MSRYDIADYLAVSVETVSRSLTDLKHRGVIKLAGTRIVMIVNRNALEDGERTRLAA